MPENHEPTTKQQRDARRAEKVAAFAKSQAQQKRQRLAVIIGSSVAGLALVVTLVVIAVTSMTPGATPGDADADSSADSSATIEDLVTFENLTGAHVDPDPVDYEAAYGMHPPAGGDHFGQWLNCGVYSEPQQNESAVHSMEHGAVWVTYDPDVVSDDELSTLRASLPDTYIVLSPYPGLPSPVVASAWGYQVQLDGVDDERLGAFIQNYWQSPSGPEPGAPCDGSLDGPGKLS